jgi:hypothetical protein
VFLQGDTAIRNGVFAEDPEEVSAYLGGIVEGLDPRDPAEDALAEGVANALLAERRLARLTAEAFAAAGTVSTAEHRRVTEASQRLEHDRAELQTLRDALAAESTLPEYQAVVEVFERRHKSITTYSKRAWRDVPLETPEDWQHAYETLCRELWGGESGQVVDWLEAELVAVHHELGVLDGTHLKDAATRSLEAFDRITIYAGRTGLALERALNRYRQLRSRPEPPTPAPASTSPAPAEKRYTTPADIPRETNP